MKPFEALLPVKTVDALDGAGVFSRHYTKNVVFHMKFIKQAGRPHDTVESPLVLRVPAVAVVELRRAVQGKAHQKMVLREKTGPFFVDAEPIGLDRIADLHADPAVLLLQRYRPAKKIQPRQSGLAALEGKGTDAFGAFHRGDNDFLHVGQRQHPLKGVLPVIRHVPVKAVGTAHIAG